MTAEPVEREVVLSATRDLVATHGLVRIIGVLETATWELFDRDRDAKTLPALTRSLAVADVCTQLANASRIAFDAKL